MLMLPEIRRAAILLSRIPEDKRTPVFVWARRPREGWMMQSGCKLVAVEAADHAVFEPLEGAGAPFVIPLGAVEYIWRGPSPSPTTAERWGGDTQSLREVWHVSVKGRIVHNPESVFWTPE